MAKAKRELRAFASRAQLFLYTVDARAPASTFYPEILPGKKPIIVFTKSDLADPIETPRWRKWFQSRGFETTSPAEIKKQNLAATLGPFPKALVIGLPNVGKSTLINQLIGRKKAKTGAAPGITRGPQWIKLGERIYLLDTPGIFYPKNLTQEKAWRLAAVGTIPEKNYEAQLLMVAQNLVSYMRENYGKFKETEDFFHLLEGFGKKRGLLAKGGSVDLQKAALHLILDFQKGKWGRVTLEKPDQI